MAPPTALPLPDSEILHPVAQLSPLGTGNRLPSSSQTPTFPDTPLPRPADPTQAKTHSALKPRQPHTGRKPPHSKTASAPLRQETAPLQGRTSPTPADSPLPRADPIRKLPAAKKSSFPTCRAKPGSAMDALPHSIRASPLKKAHPPPLSPFPHSDPAKRAHRAMGQNSHSTAESDAIPASKPHTARKNSIPPEIRSHFNRKIDVPSDTPTPLLRKTSAPKSGPPPLLWGNGVSGDESPPTFVGEPALFRVNQPHPGGAAGNPRVTAPRREVILSNRKQLSRTGRIPPNTDG